MKEQQASFDRMQEEMTSKENSLQEDIVQLHNKLDQAHAATEGKRREINDLEMQIVSVQLQVIHVLIATNSTRHETQPGTRCHRGQEAGNEQPGNADCVSPATGNTFIDSNKLNQAHAATEGKRREINNLEMQIVSVQLQSTIAEDTVCIQGKFRPHFIFALFAL